MPRPLPTQKVPTERLAINLFDIGRVDLGVLRLVLGGKLDLRKEAAIRISKLAEDTAVPFTCDLLTAAIACDVLRSENRKLGENPIRIYLAKPGGNWSRLGGNEVLTITEGGVALDPRVFPSMVTAESYDPLVPKPLV